MPEEMWRTDDTPLATYLSDKYPMEKMEWIDESCWFYFLEADGLIDDVMDFQSGVVSVEPKSFLSKYNQVKRKMFALRDAERTRARS